MRTFSCNVERLLMQFLPRAKGGGILANTTIVPLAVNSLAVDSTFVAMIPTGNKKALPIA